MRALLATGVILGFLHPAAAETSLDDLRKAEQDCERGARYLVLGNHRRAARWFERALATVPSHPEAQTGLGHIAMSERRYEDALARYDAAVHGYADLGDLLIERQARAYRDAQTEIAKLQRAMADVERLGSLYRFTPSQVHNRLRELRRSIEILEGVEPPDPEAAGESPGVAHFFLGNALFRLDRLDEAVEEWNRCLQRSPRFVYALNNLAVAYWKLGRFADALRCLDRAEDLGMRVNPHLRRDLELAWRAREPIVL